MLKGIIILLTTTLLLGLTWAVFFPEWQLTSYHLSIGKTILTPLIFALLLTSIIAWKLKNNQILFTAGLPLMFIAACISYSMVKPLDSHSQPVDVAVIKNHGDGHKTIVHKSFNYKHNNWQTDTALIKEVFIFRKYIRP